MSMVTLIFRFDPIEVQGQVKKGQMLIVKLSLQTKLFDRYCLKIPQIPLILTYGNLKIRKTAFKENYEYRFFIQRNIIFGPLQF